MPAAYAVSHLVPVHVEAVGAADVVKNDGLTAHGLERAHRRVHAARQQRHCLLEYLHSTTCRSATRQKPEKQHSSSLENLRTSSDLVVFSCCFVGAGGADTACAQATCLKCLCCDGARAVPGMPGKQACATMFIVCTCLRTIATQV